MFYYILVFAMGEYNIMLFDMVYAINVSGTRLGFIAAACAQELLTKIILKFLGF